MRKSRFLITRNISSYTYDNKTVIIVSIMTSFLTHNGQSVWVLFICWFTSSREYVAHKEDERVMIRPVVFPVCHTRGLDGSGCRVSCKKNKTLSQQLWEITPHSPSPINLNVIRTMLFLNRFLSIFNLDFNEMVSRWYG